ncbi:superoxide dismutase [Intrasporangium oryzae NRRL B-24470]|uniref:Superoxide dismutase n=1 Tax=Intrasporangium oryzae NRRL B-24470 TaxID=1386089 RepID=W9G7K3_9MICO|nr:hypothetical protein [Intrasporangium oryzae]EWT02166.1 superoxide dismutase [Intrasporangium oryzae NRRL B-24470]
MRLTRKVLTTSLGLVMAGAMALAPTGALAAEPFPELIPLPDNWQAEGIASGTGTTVYSGSLASGAVWKGDLRTGLGSVLVPGGAGRVAVGLKESGGLLFVAGGPTGQAYVFDAATGAEVATYQLSTDPSFINDVTVTRDAAYFTNSSQAELYRLPLRNGAPAGAPETIPLTGDWQQLPGFSANGIEASPDGSVLLVVNSTNGLLYRVDPATGVATTVATAASLTAGDGILLRGPILYVVRNQLNEVVVLRMSPDYASATPTGVLTDPDFAVPTTIASFGTTLYAVNARFGLPPGPFDIVKVDGS